jgi:hypothetical protein
MSEILNGQSRKINDGHASNLATPGMADTTGLWFAVAVLCAFIAAGTIVYRTGNSDGGPVVMAADGASRTAALSAPVGVPPIAR